ncbi:MAG: tetratricopeptide repeat protein [Deltaproteobacteria bacterium]|nr:tetratricopeptide repeat protein [Deltaproteobacteria bacterium]
MRGAVLLPSLALAPSLLCASCFLWTTKDDGTALRRDVDQLREREARMETEAKADRAKLTEMIDRARADLVSMEDTLTKATRVLARNSADFGAEMETIKDRQNEIDGALAEMRHGIEELGKTLVETQSKVNDFALAAGLDLPVDAAKVPAKPEDHLAAIKDALANGRYGEVRSLAKIFLDRYPTSTDADDVQLLTAKSYLEQKRWAKALGVLRQFTEKYPKSELAPEVLFEMTRAFFELGDCTDARVLVEALGARHAKSPFAARAKELETSMLKEKSRCTS